MSESISELCETITRLDARMSLRTAQSHGDADDSEADYESMDHLDELQDADLWEIRRNAMALVRLVKPETTG